MDLVNGRCQWSHSVQVLLGRERVCILMLRSLAESAEPTCEHTYVRRVDVEIQVEMDVFPMPSFLEVVREDAQLVHWRISIELQSEALVYPTFLSDLLPGSPYDIGAEIHGEGPAIQFRATALPHDPSIEDPCIIEWLGPWEPI